jgi:hypothetical protein
MKEHDDDLQEHIEEQLKARGYVFPRVMTVAEAQRLMRVGRSRMYEALRTDPRFKDVFFKWGRSYRILRDRLLALMEEGGFDARG